MKAHIIYTALHQKIKNHVAVRTAVGFMHDNDIQIFDSEEKYGKQYLDMLLKILNALEKGQFIQDHDIIRIITGFPNIQTMGRNIEAVLLKCINMDDFSEENIDQQIYIMSRWERKPNHAEKIEVVKAMIRLYRSPINARFEFILQTGPEVGAVWKQCKDKVQPNYVNFKKKGNKNAPL